MRESHDDRIRIRKEKIKEQNGICVYCNKKIEGKASLDHIIPVILGGGVGEENLVACHKYCNVNKRDLIVFSNLYDRIIYPIVNIPYFFKVDYIQTNNFKKENK